MVYSSGKWSRSNKDNIICRINQKWLRYFDILLFRRRPFLFALQLGATNVCNLPSEAVWLICDLILQKKRNNISNYFLRVQVSNVSEEHSVSFIYRDRSSPSKPNRRVDQCFWRCRSSVSKRFGKNSPKDCNYSSRIWLNLRVWCTKGINRVLSSLKRIEEFRKSAWNL